MSDPTIERLKELFDYAPETGSLTWRERDRNLTGREAGGIDRGHGYRRVNFDGKLHLAHRIAWAMTHGAWPQGQIDHINGNRSDNRISNLRAISRSENLRNKARYRNNKSGCAGVHWHSQHRKWNVCISIDGKRRHVGLFTDLKAAIDAREAANTDHGYHPNHGRSQ